MNSKKIIIPIIILFLVIVNIAAIYKYHVLKQDYKDTLIKFGSYRIKTSIGFSTLPDIAVSSISGEIMELQQSKEKATVIIFVNPTDCVSCFQVMTAMNKIAYKFPEELRIIAFLREKSTQDVNLLLRGTNFNYSIVLDPENKILPGINPNIKTPFMIITAGTGRISSYGPVVLHENFVSNLIKMLEEDHHLIIE